jgi:hypothetical protein
VVLDDPKGTVGPARSRPSSLQCRTFSGTARGSVMSVSMRPQPGAGNCQTWALCPEVGIYGPWDLGHLTFLTCTMGGRIIMEVGLLEMS